MRGCQAEIVPSWLRSSFPNAQFEGNARMIVAAGMHIVPIIFDYLPCFPI